MAKLSDGLRVKYEPIYPQAPVDMKFHYYETNEDGENILKIHEDNFKLIQSLGELEEFVKKYVYEDDLAESMYDWAYDYYYLKAKQELTGQDDLAVNGWGEV